MHRQRREQRDATDSAASLHGRWGVSEKAPVDGETKANANANVERSDMGWCGG